MKNNVRNGLITFSAAFILQPFIHNLIPLRGWTPNLILCLAAALICATEESGIWLAFGMLFALFSDFAFGLYTGIGMGAILAALTILILLKHVLVEANVLMAALMSVMTTWVYNFVYWLLAKAAGNTARLLTMAEMTMIQMVVNLVFFMIIYLIVSRLILKKRKWTFYFRQSR
jgi:hypothetical protein